MQVRKIINLCWDKTGFNNVWMVYLKRFFIVFCKILGDQWITIWLVILRHTNKFFIIFKLNCCWPHFIENLCFQINFIRILTLIFWAYVSIQILFCYKILFISCFLQKRHRVTWVILKLLLRRNKTFLVSNVIVVLIVDGDIKNLRLVD